jgi:tRNA G37 N-methylase TrmD
LAVPEVLLSGDHAAIDDWRREDAARRTQQRRADLDGADPAQPAGTTLEDQTEQDQNSSRKP